MFEESAKILEILSYLVTVIGFPFAIFVFIFEKRRENLAEDYEIYQRLSDEYFRFQRLMLTNSDLKLRLDTKTEGLSKEQSERMIILFDILISLFERAYILVYAPGESAQRTRMWGSWEDYMREWCRRQDFVEHLPILLKGEDPEFVAYIRKLVEEEKKPLQLDN